MKKTIYLLSFFLFSFAAAYGQKQKADAITETTYSVYFDVPDDSKFRAVEEGDINIKGTINFINGEMLQWELSYNSSENKPRSINFNSKSLAAINKFQRHLETVVQEPFWQSITNCLSSNSFTKVFICINELPAFEHLACLAFGEKDCNK